MSPRTVETSHRCAERWRKSESLSRRSMPGSIAIFLKRVFLKGAIAYRKGRVSPGEPSVAARENPPTGLRRLSRWLTRLGGLFFGRARLAGKRPGEGWRRAGACSQRQGWEVRRSNEMRPEFREVLSVEVRPAQRAGPLKSLCDCLYVRGDSFAKQ